MIELPDIDKSQRLLFTLLLHDTRFIILVKLFRSLGWVLKWTVQLALEKISGEKEDASQRTMKYKRDFIPFFSFVLNITADYRK